MASLIVESRALEIVSKFRFLTIVKGIHWTWLIFGSEPMRRNEQWGLAPTHLRWMLGDLVRRLAVGIAGSSCLKAGGTWINEGCKKIKTSDTWNDWFETVKIFWEIKAASTNSFKSEILVALTLLVLNLSCHWLPRRLRSWLMNATRLEWLLC